MSSANQDAENLELFESEMSAPTGSWSFLGFHDPESKQSYPGKIARPFLSWPSLSWPITGFGRGRQHHGCVLGFSPCSSSVDRGGRGRTSSTCEMACSWVVQDSHVLASSCVCHRETPYLLSVLFFWGSWEGKARVLWDGCENYQTRFSITSTINLSKFRIEINRVFSWAWILTLIAFTCRVWRLGFLHLNVGIWWRILR